MGNPKQVRLDFISLCFQDKVSLCSPGCPGTHAVDQAGLEHRDLPASTEIKRYVPPLSGYFVPLKAG